MRSNLKTDKLIRIAEAIYNNSNNFHVKILNCDFYFNEDKVNLDIKALKNQITNTKYPELIGEWSEDANIYNPLEADRDAFLWNLECGFYVHNNKIGITIPGFNIVFWYLCYQLKRMPSFTEYAQTYILTNFRKLDKYIDNRIMYKKNEPHGNVHGEIIQFNDGGVFENRLLYFRDGVKCNLPINQITTEQVLYRLRKIYGSFVRDLYHPILFASYGADVIYDSKYDISGGVDMLVNGYVCCSYVGTKASQNFARDKQNFRHGENVLMDEWGDILGFKLITEINGQSGIIVPTEKIVQTIIRDCKQGKVKSEYHY